MKKMWWIPLVTGIALIVLALCVIYMRTLPTMDAGGNVLDACDATSGWSSHSTLSLDTADPQEGSASLKADGSGTDWSVKSFSPAVDSGVTESDGYLELWLYVSDVSPFTTDGQIEITSSGGPDVNEYNWAISGLGLSNGWNSLHLKLSDATKSGTPDLSAINYFRIYQFLSAPITVKIDDIRFSSDSGTTWVELTYDDFESGWGNYSDGGDDASRYTGGTYAHQGSARIVNPTYGTDDIVVVDYDVVSDYSADNTAANDATTAIQNALNDCYANGGGTVWMPAGTYKVSATISIPPFCTLRGDWQDPDTGTRYGTVVRAEIASGSTPLFLIGGSAGAMGLTVYYPNQNALNPVTYGWTFEIRGRGGSYGEADYHASSVINVTLINAYKGVGVNAPPYKDLIHELSRVENVKGTALYRGLDARNCADVGMWRNIKLSNSYWANAPSAYNPPSRSTLDTWTRANGEAFVLADVEWDSFYAISAEDYNVGIHFVDGARIAFAGQFAWARITDTDVAVQADANSIDDRSSNWGASFLRSVLAGSADAVENNASGYIHVTDSTVTGGIGGTSSGRVSTASPGTSPTSYTEIGTPPKPTRSVLYDVSQSPYNAPSTLGSVPTGDATSAIQSALTDAGNAGGGVVYLPAGWYKISTHLTVPANVELRGSSAVMNRSQSALSNGTVLFAYQEGSSNPALVTLNGNTSGVRGLRVFYPNNGFATADSWKIYPYAIRINGVDDAYVVNVAIENGYQGVVADAGSDRHYIKNVVGATTHGFIRIWASTEGWIEDCHSNLNFWPRNAYSITPWMEEAGDVFWGSFLTTRKNNDRLIHIDNASNEHLLNNFSYGGHHGAHVYNATAEVFNIGTDNVGGYTVVGEGGATVAVMNSMRYNGNGNTSGVTSTYNELNLD